MTQREPLDRALNVAVLHMASKVCPTGYDVGASAPDNLASLVDSIERNHRIMVNDENNDRTIFACPEVNAAFRAWHDWTHYQLRAPFTLDGELTVAHRQCEDLALIYGHSAQCRKWQTYVMAEVYGQALAYAKTGRFPVDQVAFDLAYLATGDLGERDPWLAPCVVP